jgi:hypothetical protein
MADKFSTEARKSLKNVSSYFESAQKQNRPKSTPW